MNLEDFYRGRGEDYPVIIGRFMGNENLLKKFVKNFPDDPTYGRLCEAMETEKADGLFSEVQKAYKEVVQGISGLD